VWHSARLEKKVWWKRFQGWESVSREDKARMIVLFVEAEESRTRGLVKRVRTRTIAHKLTRNYLTN
jgi:hypothetical protein